MLRVLRERTREKLGRLLQDYVTTEIGSTTARLSDEVVELREQLRAAEQRLASSMSAWERRQRRDIYTAAEIAAAESSAEFVQREMGRATAYFSKADTLAAAVKAAPGTGLYLEFGVAAGESLRRIAALAPAGMLFGFDSFEGLPEHWRSGFPAGAFVVDALPDVPGAELVPGWFDQTLPGFLAEHDGPVAFLHLDADLYSSTKTVLEALEPRLQPGTVLLFDEFFNYPGWEHHEYRAWAEFVARTGVEFEYLGFTADDEQVCLRLTSVPRA